MILQVRFLYTEIHQSIQKHGLTVGVGWRTGYRSQGRCEGTFIKGSFTQEDTHKSEQNLALQLGQSLIRVVFLFKFTPNKCTSKGVFHGKARHHSQFHLICVPAKESFMGKPDTTHNPCIWDPVVKDEADTVPEDFQSSSVVLNQTLMLCCRGDGGTHGDDPHLVGPHIDQSDRTDSQLVIRL